MKKTIFIISIILNLLFLIRTVIAYRNKIEALSVKKYKIVFYGDSMTQSGDWRLLLHRSDIQNSGIPGFTTHNLLITLKSGVLRFKPDTCYIMAGINDILYGVPAKRIFINYTLIIDTLLKHHITPVMQSTLYTSADSVNYSVDTLNNYLINLSKKRSIRYIDINKLYSKNHFIQSQFTFDGIHLKKIYYDKWANALR